MDNNQYIIASIVLVVILIIMYNAYTIKSAADNLLEGMWVASEEFCNESEIDGMFIYIGPPDSSKWERKAYLIMHADNAVITNKKLLINYSNGSIFDYFNPLISGLDFYGSISIKEDKDDDELDGISEAGEIPLSEIMPSDMEVELDMTTGKMIWAADDTIYARLFKDNIATDLGVHS